MEKTNHSANLFAGVLVVGLGSVPLTLIVKYGLIDGMVAVLVSIGIIISAVAVMYSLGLATRLTAGLYIAIREGKL